MDAEQLTSRFLKAQLAGDRRAALRVVVDEGVEQGASIHDLHMHVIKPAQYEIGRLWHENEISVAQEHLATSIAQLCLSYLYRYLKRSSPNGKRLIVGCVEGETHELGARIMADLFEAEGFDVWFLGANVPLTSLTEMVRRSPPDAVALSVSMTFNLPSLFLAAETLQRFSPKPLTLLTGGHAVTLAKESCLLRGLNVLSEDPALAVQELRGLVDTAREASPQPHG